MPKALRRAAIVASLQERNLLTPGLEKSIHAATTLTAAESIDHPVPDGFDVVTDPPEGEWRAYGHGWRVLPHDADTDGMVVIRYRRRA